MFTTNEVTQIANQATVIGAAVLLDEPSVAVGPSTVPRLSELAGLLSSLATIVAELHEKQLTLEARVATLEAPAP